MNQSLPEPLTPYQEAFHQAMVMLDWTLPPVAQSSPRIQASSLGDPNSFVYFDEMAPMTAEDHRQFVEMFFHGRPVTIQTPPSPDQSLSANTTPQNESSMANNIDIPIWDPTPARNASTAGQTPGTARTDDNGEWSRFCSGASRMTAQERLDEAMRQTPAQP